MQTVAFIVVCFLGAWGLAYLDHRATFTEMFQDIGTLWLMMIAGFLLFVVYGVLKLVFGS